MTPGVLLPQFEMIVESEDTSEVETCKEIKSDKQRLQEFESLLEEGKAGTMQGKFNLLMFITAIHSSCRTK